MRLFEDDPKFAQIIRAFRKQIAQDAYELSLMEPDEGGDQMLKRCKSRATVFTALVLTSPVFAQERTIEEQFAELRKDCE